MKTSLIVAVLLVLTSAANAGSFIKVDKPCGSKWTPKP
jgi:hypothetical protein